MLEGVGGGGDSNIALSYATKLVPNILARVVVLYIFIKHVISIKFANYSLETCDFVRKCFAKIYRRKFSNNLKRVTVKDPSEKTSALEPFLMRLLG